MATNYYDVLGVNKNASDEDLKKAYKKAAMKHHPDRNQDNKDAEVKFKEVNEAYDTLRDPQKKAAYDRFGHEAYKNGGMGSGSKHHNQGGAGAGGFGGGGFEGFDFGGGFDGFADIFADIMGGGRGRSGGRSAKPDLSGNDLQYSMSIELEDAFTGTTKEVKIKKKERCSHCAGTGSQSKKAPNTCSTCGGAGKIHRQQGFFAVAQNCPDCHGTGIVVPDPCSFCSGTGVVMENKTIEIKIPKGADNGLTLRVPNGGEAGFNGAAYGHLYIQLQIKQHKIYQRNRNDLYMKTPITFVQAILGGEVEIPNIDGKNITVKIPKGTQPGDTLRVSDKGFTILNSDHRGHLLVSLDVKIPKKISKEQEKLLKKIDEEGVKDSESFWDKIF